jgi:hypothetical protein
MSDKIELESEAGRLLRRLCEIGPVHHSDCDFQAAEWLVGNQYAYWSRGSLYPSMEGQKYFSELCINPAVTESTQKWKEEALSGMTTHRSKNSGFIVSRETDIQSAAIPSVQKHYSTTPEDEVANIEKFNRLRAQILKDLGLSEDKARKASQEGRIRWCKHCEKWGVFHKKGKYFQSMCAKCAKQRRRKNDERTEKRNRKVGEIKTTILP